MSPDSTAAVREIEIRTWPECSDVLVVDVARAIVLAHFELPEDGEATSALTNPRSPYSERSTLAISVLEADQPFLRAHFHSDSDITLEDCDASRQRLESLLKSKNLTLNDVEVPKLVALDARLEEMELAELFELLVDWHDVVERHYPQGSSYGEGESWVQRSKPENCFHFHYLAAEVTDLTEANDHQNQAAYDLFKRLVDVDASSYNLGFHLRWVYFHRAEFPGTTRPRPTAWQQLGINS